VLDSKDLEVNDRRERVFNKEFIALSRVCWEILMSMLVCNYKSIPASFARLYFKSLLNHELRCRITKTECMRFFIRAKTESELDRILNSENM
jgi:hypothetical protein